MAGVVPRGNENGELDLDMHITKSERKSMSLATCYALVAAKEALDNAEWFPETEMDKHRTGLDTISVDIILY